MNAFLVTGANGFVGTALCRELVARGCPTKAAVRGDCILEGVERVRIPALSPDTDWSVALQGVNVVIHLAARVHVMHETAADALAAFRLVNVQATENLARQAAAAGVQRLVYASSVKVNGESTARGKVYTEQDVPAPEDPYGVSKWEAEQVLRRVAAETGLEVVILRPPLMYGPAVKGNFISLLAAIRKGLPLPLAGANSNARSLLYVGNFVDALMTCSTHPAAAGQTYLVSDGEPMSTAQLIEQLAQVLRCRNPAFYFPPTLARGLAKMFGRAATMNRLFGSLHLDDQKIRRELGWQPPYTLSTGLCATVDWYVCQHTTQH